MKYYKEPRNHNLMIGSSCYQLDWWEDDDMLTGVEFLKNGRQHNIKGHSYISYFNNEINHESFHINNIQYYR